MPSKSKFETITHHVPQHLVEAFLQTAEEFFANAAGGSTPAQRAAEIRAQDHDTGLDSLAFLLNATEDDSNQAGVIAGFLAGLYNGSDFPLNLSELSGLEDDLFEHCLAVLRLAHRHAVEIHTYFPDGEARWRAMIKRWNLDDPRARAELPSEEIVYTCAYQGEQSAPGYRDVTVYVSVQADSGGTRSFGLLLSARESQRLAADLVHVHRLAWELRTPLDIREGEVRPVWL